MAGKGDKYRPVNKKKYDENYERIFGNRNISKEEKVDRLKDGIKERAKTFSKRKELSRQEVKRRIRDET